MYLSSKASRARQREAQNARNNRAEIVKALSQGQISKRDLFKWGIFTVAGGLLLKNGLSPFARSAFAAVPTGTPRSPLFGAKKFTQRLPRLRLQEPVAMSPVTRGGEVDARFTGMFASERDARRLSYHNDFTAFGGPVAENPWRNPLTDRGPLEGRPPGPEFAHQRWEEFFPKVGYVMSWGQCAPGTKFHPNFANQNPNSMWCYGPGRFTQGLLAPPLFKGRYGEPIIARIYNNTPINREENEGFGRNETQLHFHNAHNGAESDGAANAHHFPGTFYDYRWSTTLARRDKINVNGNDVNAAGPNNSTGIVKVAGDWRELQGTMWIHDHRFFFTAPNIYKGAIGMVNYYSGRDRGHETITSGNNLRLPSGTKLAWGNSDFDVNLVMSDAATDPDGQLFFDIFTTDGFLGDIPLVNFAYAPYFEVLPRKYRFRILNGNMSRFCKLALSWNGRPVSFKFIANDGNFVVNPIEMSELEIMGNAERFDIVIDFSQFSVGHKLHLVNVLRMHDDGRGPNKTVSLAEALKGRDDDPVIGSILEFRVMNSVVSVDQPGAILQKADYCGTNDKSQVPTVLTQQIPIIAPVRTRIIEAGRGGAGDSRGPNGQCTPDCDPSATFRWTIRVNGGEAHSLNANRIAHLIPKAGETEHWTIINTEPEGWDHPFHLHFEEGITMNRGGAPIGPTELNVRKDVWTLRGGGRVQFQVTFGEYGGSYVNHCHNTVHEDFAMLQRVQLLTGVDGSPQVAVTPTPNPTPDGVFFTTPEILPEGDPNAA